MILHSFVSATFPTTRDRFCWSWNGLKLGTCIFKWHNGVGEGFSMICKQDQNNRGDTFEVSHSCRIYIPDIYQKYTNYLWQIKIYKYMKILKSYKLTEHRQIWMIKKWILLLSSFLTSLSVEKHNTTYHTIPYKIISYQTIHANHTNHANNTNNTNHTNHTKPSYTTLYQATLNYTNPYQPYQTNLNYTKSNKIGKILKAPTVTTHASQIDHQSIHQEVYGVPKCSYLFSVS